MNAPSPIVIRAGAKAMARIRTHGLQAQDIAVIPAAAGGPKGLILQALDQWLFGTWLADAPRERMLVGASIGAWRMAAACQTDPAAAFKRLGDLYCGQHYPLKPSAAYVSETCKNILSGLTDGHETEITAHRYYRPHFLTVRGRGWLAAPQRGLSTFAGFTAATLANMASRVHLANHLERVVIGDSRDTASWLRAKFDAFDTHFVPLRADNIAQTLLASGTLPFIMEPVAGIPHAPAGTYWDGGLIDYHLALPYSRLSDSGGLVLYPHFTDHIVPGWLDKPLPWRRAGLGENRDWLDNVILVSPSAAFRQTLWRNRLPNRNDFQYFGLNYDARIRHWQAAIGEGQRLRDALAAFVEKPDWHQVQAL